MRNLATLLSGLIAAAFAGWFAKNRLAPKPSWDAATPDTDQHRLDRIGVLFDEMVRRIEAVRPDAIKTRTWSRRLYLVHTPTLPDPFSGNWAAAFPEHADGGNAGGCIYVLDHCKDIPELLRHEVCHLITGITDHPAWLFGAGLTLNV